MAFSDFKPDEIWALAQLLKRLTHTDLVEHAQNDSEVYDMSMAIVKLADMLKNLGYDPR